MKFLKTPEFISPIECDQFVDLIRSYTPTKPINNKHIKSVNDKLNGLSITCDLTHTPESIAITNFQGDNTKTENESELVLTIKDRISETAKIPSDHVFFQCFILGENGSVPSHYDASIPGYVTYKCNISIKGPEPDEIHAGKQIITIKNRDLFCFEASLYKHWVEPKNSVRMMLSYGFLVPYDVLGWNFDSPRIKLSNRIHKMFG